MSKHKPCISSQRARKLRRKGVYTCINKAGEQYWVPEPGQCTKESAQKVQHSNPSTVNPSAMQVWLRSL